MTTIDISNTLFFDKPGPGGARLSQADLAERVREALKPAEDGELFLEYKETESLVLDDGRLKSASYDQSQGFGLRAVLGEVSAFAHASNLNEDSLRCAQATVRSILPSGGSGNFSAHKAEIKPNQKHAHAPQLYEAHNPLRLMPFEEKVDLLNKIDSFARAADERVVQVSASLSSSWQVVHITQADGTQMGDVRPAARLSVSVILEHQGRRESASYGCGGRTDFGPWVQESVWQAAVRESIRSAHVNLAAIPAPAGELTVVLDSGWPGVLLHEAVGHGLEGDFNRKQSSTFSDMMGKPVAAPGVTVIDDGTMPNRRGSLHIDDEGTPSARNVLIEDGILVGYMQDRQNARLMGMEPTGNGRRQSFAHQPMPRMTNTFMLAGDKEPGEIIASVSDGLYAVNFGGGQVDITSGKFTFQCTEAYEIKKGKIGKAVKGATLIGNGPHVMKRISMLGNDLKLDPGIGVCGKQGQGVPVGIGQPTVKLDAITVGGTA